MGNSVACPCLEEKRRQQPADSVLVMESDGSLLRFKKGTRAREVAAGAGRRGHRVVRCDTSGTVLSESDALEASRFYFLVPGEKAGCRETYEAFWAVGASKLYLPDRAGGGKGGRGAAAAAAASSAAARAAWTPRLGPIPEASASVENASSSSAPREVSVVAGSTTA